MGPSAVDWREWPAVGNTPFGCDKRACTDCHTRGAIITLAHWKRQDSWAMTFLAPTISQRASERASRPSAMKTLVASRHSSYSRAI